MDSNSTATDQKYLDAFVAWALSFPAPIVLPRRKPTTADKYGPCPCGSGKKFKWCCMNREVKSDV
jgi:uncharacterized protein YecA (UPF0149 family)